ncbi:MAG TPA: DNA-packaging protein [Candidatus Merdicola faecigallinarum]|jgi:hypothetical protein|uniref:DNA-packaging protein n=1 Tax=Candidatus Merdicola faecigallinarum TaxID=2840862 RepID=A0A9D1M0G5_9FIRM|nr:DNA-packaging protein [Candidatus Merdicola faecigallinarum]
MKAGRPKKYTEVEIMQQKIEMYFKECEKKNEPYTVTGLCLALDICRDTLAEYAKNSEFSDTIKKAKLKVENYLEKHLITDSSTTGIIFNLKNNFGWTDKQQLEHSGNINNPFEGLSTEELRQLINDDKY